MSRAAILAPLKVPFAGEQARKTNINFHKPASRLSLVFAFALIAANMVMFCVYILGVNNYASEGYEIKKINSNLDQLTEDNKTLNIKIAELSSVSAIQNQSLSQNFVPAGQVKFLQINHYSEAYNSR